MAYDEVKPVQFSKQLDSAILLLNGGAKSNPLSEMVTGETFLLL
jgi:hypothetical protein